MGLNKIMQVKQLASVGRNLPTMLVREQFPSLPVWVLKRPGFMPRPSRFWEQRREKMVCEEISWGKY